MIRAVDALEPFRAVLLQGGYSVEDRDIGNVGTVLLAETQHALVLCVTTDWQGASECVDETQATLTHLAAEHPSPRSWDLYVVVVITDEQDSPVREAFESDTRYARKLVAVGVGESTARAERVLLPLLPLRGAANLEPIQPLRAIRAELLSEDLEPDIVEQALVSFSTRGYVTFR